MRRKKGKKKQREIEKGYIYPLDKSAKQEGESAFTLAQNNFLSPDERSFLCSFSRGTYPLNKYRVIDTTRNNYIVNCNVILAAEGAPRCRSARTRRNGGVSDRASVCESLAENDRRKTTNGTSLARRIGDARMAEFLIRADENTQTCA